MTEAEKLAIAEAALKEIAEIAVEPGGDWKRALIEAQQIALNAINKIGGSPDEPPPRPGLKLVKG